MKIISSRSLQAPACAALMISIIASTSPVGIALPAEPCSSPTISGTDSGGILIGTSKDDVISGRGGSDVIYGLAGDDIICGGSDTESAPATPTEPPNASLSIHSINRQ